MGTPALLYLGRGLEGNGGRVSSFSVFSAPPHTPEPHKQGCWPHLAAADSREAEQAPKVQWSLKQEMALESHSRSLTKATASLRGECFPAQLTVLDWPQIPWGVTEPRGQQIPLGSLCRVGPPPCLYYWPSAS